MTVDFAPLLMGMVVVLGLCILGMALDAWVYYAWAQPKTGVEMAEAKVEVLYRKRFFCPGKGREVEVDFRAPWGEPGNLLGVEHCSAFGEKEEISCDKACLYLPEAKAVAPLFRPLPALI
jgi:hypothetical protein